MTIDRQDQVVEKTGLFVVRACPGGRKTSTVAKRLARFLSEWPHAYQGIATISFTNVAWEEIEAYLAGDFQVNTPLRHPHFLGTIDSFINNYIFLPFGHLVMGCDARPVLTGPPHDTSEPICNWLWWRRQECSSSKCKLNDFSYDETGQLESIVPRSHFGRCQSNHDKCIRLKRIFNQRGYATQSDANYFALKLLQSFPNIGQALAVRFPVFMVDEAQDTSRIQMTIFDLLVEYGVKEMMLVGDPDQAIYEWRKAEPDLLNQKFDLWRENSVEFTENWRSTQSICDFASRISSLPEPMIAKNPELTGLERPPEFWGYNNEDELPELLSRFKSECDENGMEAGVVAVLTRGGEFLNKIVPGSVQRYRLDPWNDRCTRGVARSKFLFDRGRFRDAFRLLEREACKSRSDKVPYHPADLQKIISEAGFANWRAELFEFLGSLPDTNCVLSQWISETNNILIQGRSSTVNETMSIKGNSSLCRYSELTFEEVFAVPDDHQADTGCILGTVHSVKGKTFDSVLLVLKKKGANGPHYTNLLNCSIQEHEELRILYVAMTRPRKLLVLAVPNDHLPDWEHKFGGNTA